MFGFARWIWAWVYCPLFYWCGGLYVNLSFLVWCFFAYLSFFVSVLFLMASDVLAVFSFCGLCLGYFYSLVGDFYLWGILYCLVFFLPVVFFFSYWGEA